LESADRKQLLATYKSEPILAEASAYLTTFGGVCKKEVLGEIYTQIENKALTYAKGQRGELAAAAWFDTNWTICEESADF